MVAVEAQASGLPCFFSNRISKEINISNTVKFLSINKGDEKMWAKAINSVLMSSCREKICIPEIYRIDHAAKILENKYLNLLSNAK